VEGDRSIVSIRLPLAAVEPAPAEAGEETGERGRCDNEVARISLGEHSRTSLSDDWLVLAVVGPEYGWDTPQRGIHRAPPRRVDDVDG
jgi:hypothetical protein